MRNDLQQREQDIKKRVEADVLSGAWGNAAILAGELVRLYGELEAESIHDESLNAHWVKLRLKWATFERQFMQRAQVA